MSAFEVTTKDGRIIRLTPEELNIKEIKAILEREIGIRINDSDYERQSIAMIKYWFHFRENIKHKQTDSILKAALRLNAYHYQKIFGGYVVVEDRSENNGERAKDLFLSLFVPYDDGTGVLFSISEYFLYKAAVENESVGLMQIEVEFVEELIGKELDKYEAVESSVDYVAEHLARFLIQEKNPKSWKELLKNIGGTDKELNMKMEDILKSERMIKYMGEFDTLSENDDPLDGDLMNLDEMLRKAVSSENYELASIVRDKIQGMTKQRKSKRKRN